MSVLDGFVLPDTPNIALTVRQALDCSGQSEFTLYSDVVAAQMDEGFESGLCFGCKQKQKSILLVSNSTSTLYGLQIVPVATKSGD